MSSSINNRRKPFRFYSLLPVEDHRSVREAAKAGAIAGFVVTAANVVLIIATMMNYQVFRVPPGHDPHLVALGLEEITGAFAVIMALLSWRVLTGRGYISAVLAALLVVLELACIFMIRQSGVVFVGLILLKFVIDGVRGSWWLRRNRNRTDPEVFA